jgi:hypothetical protein
MERDPRARTVEGQPDEQAGRNLMTKLGLTVAAVLCLGLVAADPALSQATPAGYSQAVMRICAGALLFNGRHETGTRSGAISVSRDIRASGDRRLRRVDAVPKPARTARLATRWIATERQLVAKYAWAYLQIWYAIERAGTPRQRAELPAVLGALIHAPDELQREAARLEQALDVPDCTGGGHSSPSDTAHP